ncbi:MAG TPA: arginine deiminase [Bacteroidetes bacterium]|nr:arginine deiminase [Bacteroidota bacterium]
MTKIKTYVDSEVGQLQAVILHKPGNEVENMTPTNIKRALYSDILNLSVVSADYNQFSGVLEKVAKVFYVSDLLKEILDNQTTKDNIINKITEHCKYPEVKNSMIQRNSEELSKILIEGLPLPKNSLTNYLSKQYFALRPLHNFFYIRDASSALLENVLINRMASRVRRPESLIMDAIFENHPNFITQTFNPETSRTLIPELSMEGGDILIARKDILLIGMGSRTTSQGIDYIARKVESREYPRNIIVQELPHTPESFIHLDMVFTFLDKDECMIYEPLITNSNKYSTIHMVVDNGVIKSINQTENILETLKSLKMPVKPILCGGKHIHNQHREQWHSGANFFAFAPGKVIGYERNVHTIEEMHSAGYEIVSAKDVIAGKVDLEKIKKVVVTIHGAELSRGGGGARCMTMPIWRKEIE